MKSKHYKISKSVELPKSGRSFGQFCPFKDMDVGDSFSFSLGDKARVESMAHSYGQKNGCAFFVQINDEGTVWRTA